MWFSYIIKLLIREIFSRNCFFIIRIDNIINNNIIYINLFKIDVFNK